MAVSGILASYKLRVSRKITEVSKAQMEQMEDGTCTNTLYAQEQLQKSNVRDSNSLHAHEVKMDQNQVFVECFSNGVSAGVFVELIDGC
jgi:hypothetical protein